MEGVRPLQSIKSRDRQGRTRARSLALAMALGLAAPAAAAQSTTAVKTDFVVYVADGEFDPMVPHPDDRFTNCDPVMNMCDGEYFQRAILGRSRAEMLTAEEDAKQHFKGQFGLDVDDPTNAGRLFFRMFQIDPRVNYHVVSASDSRVPKEGWPVHYGGWIAMVTDPNGFDLGGKYVGVHVGPGAMFLYGENVIERTRRHGRWRGAEHHDNLVVHYEQRELPYVPSPGAVGVGDSALMFKLHLASDELGDGLARGRGEIIPRADGRIRVDIVSVLTFPGTE